MGTMFRKSSFSNPNGDCVEVSPINYLAVVVRDSKQAGQVNRNSLVYTTDEWAAFTCDVKLGRYDSIVLLAGYRGDTVRTDAVGVTPLADGTIAMRYWSRGAKPPALLFSVGEWDAFVAGVLNGEFDVELFARELAAADN